jgi:hypothetical protein
MPNEIPKKTVTDLINQIMHIQKRYAHEQLGAKNDRRNEIKKLINRLVSDSEGKRGD